MGNCLPDHLAEMLGLHAGQVNQGKPVRGVAVRWLVKNLNYTQTPLFGWPGYRKTTTTMIWTLFSGPVCTGKRRHRLRAASR